MRQARLIGIVAGVAAMLLVPVSLRAAGFALFEHSARAVGLGGAFGATADDPSAIYFNPAGLAFQDGFNVAAGVYFITESATFNGVNPFPGQGYSVNMKSQIFFPAHVYAAGPLGTNVRWGLGVYCPFGLGTWWPSDYAGRYITKRVDLKVFNINPTLSFRLGRDFALAVGADYFDSDIDLTKSLPAINPYTQQVAEVGQVHMYTPMAGGWGWNIGLLGKFDGGWSVGATYRSNVTVNYKGSAKFQQFQTGYADFDAIVAGSLPFAAPPDATSKIKYPNEVRLALAWHGERWGVEADAVRMGWSSFTDLPITLPGYAALSQDRPENYQDADTYRLGVEYKSSPTLSWQFGALRDMTPVPVNSVSPLLPDANRTGFSVGAGWKMTPKTELDVSYLYLRFDPRSTQGQDHDNFNGTYNTTANLFGFTVVHKF
jgi:long-chain fatty acid transport protein